ncbi:MAG TPA: type II toxin-antitoxin system HicB family antitoxin [Allocoleopsis sp.]
MRSLKNYTVVLRPDSNGTFVAYVPAIAGCHAWEQTTEEAQAELINVFVFEMIREEYQEAGKELSTPQIMHGVNHLNTMVGYCL